MHLLSRYDDLVLAHPEILYVGVGESLDSRIRTRLLSDIGGMVLVGLLTCLYP